MSPAATVKLNLRLPKGLHRRLAQQAKRNNVSLNTEIINLLDGGDDESIDG
jgi:predicted HicB family RNase H-like nuclease